MEWKKLILAVITPVYRFSISLNSFSSINIYLAGVLTVVLPVVLNINNSFFDICGKHPVTVIINWYFNLTCVARHSCWSVLVCDL